MAHEFGHVFLGDHVIDDRGTPDPGDDIHTDADGHDLTDPDNLMFGPSQGDKLTDDQIQQLNQSARTRARNSEHGSWVDDIGDVGRPHIDLFVGSVFAPNLAGDLDIAIVVGGLHPDGTAVSSRFELLFDSDNNVATGTAIGSFAGIDRIVEIALVGRFPFVAPDGTFTATVREAISGASMPLTPGGVQRLPRILDSRDPSRPPSSFDFADAIQQKIPLPVLGLSAGQVPVGIRAISVDSGEVDEASFLFTLSLTPGLRAIRPGFNASTLPGNDDESTGFVPLGFSADFFGTSFTGLFVNNNGNVTFDSPLEEFTPFGLTATNRVIIAPYFADVDTRQGNVVTFGAGTVNGRPAFGVNWPGVGCFDETTSVLNFFQVLLVDRSDIASGDFDIEFNYDSIQWEAGQASGGDDVCQGGDAARVGFSNGTGVAGTFFELTGSGIPGAFLDANTVTGLVHNSLNSSQPGRYAFSVRSGVPVVEDGDGDGVADELDNCPAVANPDQADGTLNGIGDACETPGLLNSTAAFMRAGFDGTTFVEPTSLLVADEPTFLAQLVRIVDFRVDAGLSASAEGTATNLVDSLVDLNLLPPDQANALIAAILQQVTPALRGDIDRDGDVDLDDITILLRDRNKAAGASVCGLLCDLDSDGMITALDARIVVTLCTRARCATQ
jgi:hypothetical protein